MSLSPAGEKNLPPAPRHLLVTYLLFSSNMPANKSVKTAFSLIENDNSKILGLTVGKHNVKPGQFIPKAGKSFFLTWIRLKDTGVADH